MKMYLDKIIATKREELKNLSIIGKIRVRDIYNPVESLRQKPFITEIKKASPSAGEIKTGVDIIKQARAYRDGGAGAISVLTDTEYFRGSIDDLTEIAGDLDIPLLCKDFIISEVQVENAYRAGADFILLIAAVLEDGELKRLTDYAKGLGLKVLFEIHGLEEFRKIENLEPELVGVNSRDLKSFKIEKQRAASVIGDLKKKGPFLVVAESGIENSDDVRMFSDAGADAFLVGTVLMRSENPSEKMKELYSGTG